jgi:dUTP pyrophosphatase
MGFPTGVKMAIPEGYYGRVAPKSGLASKAGLDVLAGVIDSDYRGEIIVLLVNLGQSPVVIHNHEKIAQLIFERAEQAYVYEVEELNDTPRGSKGFGSTGSW